MGGPTPAKPIKPPTPIDEGKLRLNALAYSEMERRIRASQGRASQFVTRDVGRQQNQFKTLLGQ